MLASILLSAIRALQRDPWHAAVNVLGLSVALAASLLIALYVRHELSYEDFFAEPDRVYRVELELAAPGQAAARNPRSPYPLPAALQEDFGGQLVATGQERRASTVSVGDVRLREWLNVADERLFDVLDFPVAEGDAAAALRRPGTIVVSRRMAAQLFGEEPPIGRTVRVNGDLDLTVAAVLEDPRPNTGYPIDFLASLATPELVVPEPEPAMANWRAAAQETFIRLESGVTAERLVAQLPAFAARRKPADMAGWDLALRLRPLRSIHLTAVASAPIGSGDANAYAVAALSATGAFLIFIACFSYINLATARSLLRIKEVGLRKILGGRTEHLALQFLTESAAVTAFSFALALGLTAVAVPVFANLVARPLALAELVSPGYVALALGLFAFVSLAAGAYPAIVLASRKPVELFQAKGGFGEAGGLLRMGIVGVQFALTATLMIGAVVVFAQLAFLRAFDLGFDKRGLFVVYIYQDQIDDGRGNAFREALAQSPHFSGVTWSNTAGQPGYSGRTPLARAGEPAERARNVLRVSVGENYFDVYGLAPLAGRVFSSARGEDEARLPTPQEPVTRSSVVLTASAAELFGFRSPAEAIGAELVSEIPGAGRLDVTVVGVVPDVHLRVARQPIEPIAFFHEPATLGRFHAISARVRDGSEAAARAHAQELWSELVGPEFMPSGSIDDFIANMNAEDRRQSRLLAVFAGLALFVSSLGLFALASFVAAQRTHEIAVRKVLGASTADVSRLLLWDFAKPVLLTNVVAWPLAYAVVSPWLARFAYRIELSPALFLGVSALAMAAALAAILFRTLATARTPPAVVLRAE